MQTKHLFKALNEARAVPRPQPDIEKATAFNKLVLRAVHLMVLMAKNYFMGIPVDSTSKAKVDAAEKEFQQISRQINAQFPEVDDFEYDIDNTSLLRLSARNANNKRTSLVFEYDDLNEVSVMVKHEGKRAYDITKHLEKANYYAIIVGLIDDVITDENEPTLLAVYKELKQNEDSRYTAVDLKHKANNLQRAWIEYFGQVGIVLSQSTRNFLELFVYAKLKEHLKKEKRAFKITDSFKYYLSLDIHFNNMPVLLPERWTLRGPGNPPIQLRNIMLKSEGMPYIVVIYDASVILDDTYFYLIITPNGWWTNSGRPDELQVLSSDRVTRAGMLQVLHEERKDGHISPEMLVSLADFLRKPLPNK